MKPPSPITGQAAPHFPLLASGGWRCCLGVSISGLLGRFLNAGSPTAIPQHKQGPRLAPAEVGSGVFIILTTLCQ